MKVKDVLALLEKYDSDQEIVFKVTDWRWPDRPTHIVGLSDITESDNYFPTVQVNLWNQ